MAAHLYTVAPSPSDTIWQPYKSSGKSLPSSVDNGALYGPALDQESLGSCSAFASTQWRIALRQQAGFSYERLSELAQYYEERALEGTTNRDSGATMADAIRVLETFGGMPEQDDAYDPGYQSQYTQAPPNDWDATLRLNPNQTFYIDHTRIDDIKDALAQHMPMMIAHAVYAEMESPDVARTGMLPMPASASGFLGGHMENIKGYDDNVKVFPTSKGSCKVKNQWGNAWALNGEFWMPYEYIEQYAYDIVVGSPDNAVAPVPHTNKYALDVKFLHNDVYPGQVVGLQVKTTMDEFPVANQTVELASQPPNALGVSSVKTDASGQWMDVIQMSKPEKVTVTGKWHGETSISSTNWITKPTPKPAPPTHHYSLIINTTFTTQQVALDAAKKLHDTYGWNVTVK